MNDITPQSLSQIGNVAPLEKASIFNTALPAAEASLLATGLTSAYSPTFFRIYAVLSVSGILRVARTIDGTTITEDLNNGIKLKADSAYLFSIECRNTDSINFRYSVTSGIIKIFRVDEIGASE